MRAWAGLLTVLLASLVLAGCTHNQHRATAEAAYYHAQAAASERAPIIEMVARPGEQITLAGVERFAVYAPADGDPVRQYQAGAHPGVQMLSILADAGLKGFGIDRLASFGLAAIENAGGNSAVITTTAVGGNLGDTQIDASRTRIDDRSVTARDIRGDETRTRIDDRSVTARDIRGDETYSRGDEIRDACVGEACRNYSPGPIDESDNSNNPITDPPPVPQPAPGGG
jgi:hypothetical protein